LRQYFGAKILQSREKVLLQKFARKMLMKLTPEDEEDSDDGTTNKKL